MGTHHAFAQFIHLEHASHLFSRLTVERQIMLGFAASPAVPQFHGGLGKVDYFWESKQRGLGLLLQRQLNIRRLFALETRVTKLSSFGGSTMTSSGGMKNCIDFCSLVQLVCTRLYFLTSS